MENILMEATLDKKPDLGCIDEFTSCSWLRYQGRDALWRLVSLIPLGSSEAYIHQGNGGKFGGGALKAVELTTRGLLHVVDPRQKAAADVKKRAS
jgi:hypothetical protein